MKEKKRKVYISVDCGFDKFKVAINKYCFSLSSKMVDVTDTLDSTNAGIGADNTYIKYNNKIYEFGDSIDYALSLRNNLKKYKEFLDTFRNLSRFNTDAFKTSLLAAIGYSIYCYDREMKEDERILYNLDNIEFCIGIALPHGSMNEWPALKNFLMNIHEFTILVGASLVKFDIKLDFTAANFLCNSQVVAAFLYQATDDKGVMEKENSLLPCAIVDAGYKTLGCFEIAGNLAINTAHSNTDFAMYNIDNLVAERVRIEGKEFDYLQVQHHARGKGNENVRSNGIMINVKEIYEEVLENLSKKLLAYLEINYSLDDLNCLIITGGTGVAYEKHIRDYMDKNHKGLKVILSDKPYKGKEKISPMYAIVLGLHKQLQSKYAA